jgi:hypothetical protein
MKYSEAYDKIIQAYFNDEIKPNNTNFCFCGTLCGGKQWASRGLQNIVWYSYEEFGEMEKALFSPWPHVVFYANGMTGGRADELAEDYEEKLFVGMCAAIEVLKQIHITRGEIIDETPSFTKRQLQPA